MVFKQKKVIKIFRFPVMKKYPSYVYLLQFTVHCQVKLVTSFVFLFEGFLIKNLIQFNLKSARQRARSTNYQFLKLESCHLVSRSAAEGDRQCRIYTVVKFHKKIHRCFFFLFCPLKQFQNKKGYTRIQKDYICIFSILPNKTVSEFAS